jgi:MFS family permease
LLKRTFKAFQYHDFRRLWLGACTSSIGTWMQKLAQSWLVLELSNSPFLLGLDAFLGELPVVLFSLLGGVAADRMDRRRLLLISQFIQMTAAFLLAGLIAAGLVRIWHILTLSFVVGLAQAFGGPAYMALLPSLVRSEDLSNAIALNSIQFNLARVIGPMLGGLALTRLGAPWCFALNGLSFLAVIASLLAIHVRFVPRGGRDPFLTSLGEGLRFVRRRPAMPELIGLAFAVTMLGLPLVVFLPVFARDVFRRGASAYTLLLLVHGGGSIAGALLVAALGRRARKGKLALAALLGLGAATAGFALSGSLPLSCLVLFLAGAALMAVFSLASTLVQEITSDAMRGRVMSVYNVAFRGGMPVGSLLTGALAPRFGAPPVLAVNGLLIVALAAYFLLLRRRLSAL